VAGDFAQVVRGSCSFEFGGRTVMGGAVGLPVAGEEVGDDVVDGRRSLLLQGAPLVGGQGPGEADGARSAASIAS
jgi:hypothetical protein